MSIPANTLLPGLLRLVLLLAAFLFAGSLTDVATAQAQPTDSVSAAADDLSQGAPEVADPAVSEGPVIPVDPRNFYHVFAAFGVAWALVLGYTVSVGQRLRRLEEELTMLRR